eukprot:scaffold72919_cov62-Phaeocystis_antarctica.AAC.1
MPQHTYLLSEDLRGRKLSRARARAVIVRLSDIRPKDVTHSSPPLQRYRELPRGRRGPWVKPRT